MKPAPYLSRSLAFILDFALITAVLTGIEWFIPDVPGVTLQVIVGAGEMVFLIGYFVVSLSRFQTTLGMRLFKLSVVNDATGERLGVGRALLRSVALPFSFVMGVGVLMAFFNPRRQTFHDMIAGTRVIRDQRTPE